MQHKAFKPFAALTRTLGCFHLKIPKKWSLVETPPWAVFGRQEKFPQKYPSSLSDDPVRPTAVVHITEPNDTSSTEADVADHGLSKYLSTGSCSRFRMEPAMISSDHVAVFGWQGSQFVWRRAAV